MFLEASVITSLLIVGAVGGFAGLVAGFLASADNLFGTILMGIIGGVALSAIMRAAGVPSIYGVGEDNFSLVWGAVGGLVLGFVVGRSNV
jgi:uncharacterized membrane protein YeaQ/YmgE (transglycosylase-associated protein family)